ncbi:MAG TPA: fibronectin type III domain-containing protein [Candidatus Polarisedimenticolia bacterium]|nr:fibronectin type III domain-containing protein [Candidatus Polarisedimenticolia bacterium]
MPRAGGDIRPKVAAVAGFALLVSFMFNAPLFSATTIQLSWSPNSEPDLSGYRLRYGTSPGTYTQTINVGNVTSYSISGLDSSLTYYFVLHAYDGAGNVSLPSNEASGKPSIVVGTAPTVATALEVASGSVYILQSGQHSVRVTGANFQAGAVASLGSGVTCGATSVSGGDQLTFTVNVNSSAALGPRTLTISNPDNGSGNLSPALVIAKTADVTRDCLVDGSDLNAISRAWITMSGSPDYNAAADLDGNGTIDGEDVAIFSRYFGLQLAVCP